MGILKVVDVFISPVENLPELSSPPFNWLKRMTLPLARVKVGNIQYIRSRYS